MLRPRPWADLPWRSISVLYLIEVVAEANLFAASRGMPRTARYLDVHKCVPELHCERTEQVTTVCSVAGLPSLLQRGSGGRKTDRTDCLRGATELVRCRSQFREVAGTRGSLDFPFGIDRRLAEFSQQRNDGDLVVTQPCCQHRGVNGRCGFPRVGWTAGDALDLDRQPAFQGRVQAIDGHGLD